jgi:hypothetical protein
MFNYKSSLLAFVVFMVLAVSMPASDVEASFTQFLVPTSKGTNPYGWTRPTCTNDWLADVADYNSSTYCQASNSSPNKLTNYYIDPDEIISSSSFFSVQLQITYKTSITTSVSVQVHKPDESSYTNYSLPTLNNTNNQWLNTQVTVYDTYSSIGQSLNFTKENIGTFPFGFIISDPTNYPLYISSFRVIITDEDTTSTFPNLASPSFGLSPFNCGSFDIPCQIASGFYKVITYLFIPSDNDWNNIKNSFNGLWDTIKTKPPVGYFTTAKTAFDGLTVASGSYYLTFAGLDSGNSPLKPLKIGLVWIFWIMLGFWILHRIRQLEI